MVADRDGQYQFCIGDFVVALLFIIDFPSVIDILFVISLLFAVVADCPA